MTKIYCLGEAMSDTFITLEGSEIKKSENKMICLPYGEKLNVTSMKHKSGGSGFNAAVGLRRLGLDSYLIANLGPDSEGMRLKEEMDKEDVNTSNVMESEQFETKAAIILSGQDGDRTIFVYHGKGVLDKSMIDWDLIGIGSWFYLGPMPDTAKELINYLVEVVDRKNLKLVVNPGSVQIEWPNEENLKIIAKSELYILNKEEAHKIMGEIENDKELLNSFIKAGAKKVFITDGLDGSIATDGEKYYKLGIKEVKTLDMTGAGDAYFAGVVGASVLKKSLPEAMIWGAVNGAAAVEKIGAQDGMLNILEIEKQITESNLKVSEF